MDLDRLDWIASGEEPALDPHRRIIDPHHHLWRRGGSTYLADDLRNDACRSHHITDTIFVECLANYRREGPSEMRPVGETEFVAEQARRLEGAPMRIAGIVAFADLSLGSRVEEVLTEHSRVAGGLLRGVRHATAWHASAEIGSAHTKPAGDLMTQTGFIEGVRTLGRLRYTFDAWVFHTQLETLTALALAAPETTVILNHLGGPLRVGPFRHDPDARRTWRQGILTLAGLPNVVIKLGGIGMEHFFDLGWAELRRPPDSGQVADRWRDEIRWCIDAFGPDRCMFESNYPVDRQTLPYSVIWNAFQMIASDYGETEQEALFSVTAARVYRVRH